MTKHPIHKPIAQLIPENVATPTAEIHPLARLADFFRRTRKYTLDQFTHTLLFGWIEDPDAPLESFAPRLGVAPQSLAGRFTPEAVAFARSLLEAHLGRLFAADPTRQRLLDRFSAVLVQDSTTVALPADAAGQWPGCGNREPGTGTAAVKIDVRYELKTGRPEHLSLRAGKDADAPEGAAADELPVGSLHLADLGYFDTTRRLGFGEGRYFISRANSQVLLIRRTGWQSLADFLGGQPAGLALADREVVINKGSFLPVRLVALRCPPGVAARRERKLRATAKRKGEAVSAGRLALCAWTVLITNVPAAVLGVREVWVMYRLRWQVELWFKRGKQFGGWERSHGRTGDRVLVELWLKLTGTLIVMWAALSRGGPLAMSSAWKRVRLAKHYLGQVGAVLVATGEIPVRVFERMAEAFEHIRERTPRRTKPSSRDLLKNPGLTNVDP